MFANCSVVICCVFVDISVGVDVDVDVDDNEVVIGIVDTEVEKGVVRNFVGDDIVGVDIAVVSEDFDGNDDGVEGNGFGGGGGGKGLFGTDNVFFFFVLVK